jgi:hypothetical protein
MEYYCPDINDHIRHFNGRLWVSCDKYRDSACELYWLRRTINSTSGPPKRMLGHAALLEKTLIETGTGPRGCKFHQHHPDDYKNEDGSYRGTNAVHPLGHGPEDFEEYNHARLLLVLYMCFYYLIWSVTKLISISFGTYRLNMQWVLVLYILSKHMLFFLFVLVGLVGLAVAPRATLKVLYRSIEARWTFMAVRRILNNPRASSRASKRSARVCWDCLSSPSR